MIKIILNNKRIYLINNYKEFIQDYHISNAMLYFSLNKQKAVELIDVLLISEIEDAIIVGDADTNLEIFRKAFKVVKAGGGVVFNNRNELLFIYRRKKWDLPKGKLDRGETIERCAIREVYEETGIRNLEIVRPLCNTYHLYLENEMILKDTAWYLMFTEESQLKPQKEEGIKKAIWVHKNNVRFQLKNTYPSIVDIFDLLLNEES